MRPLLPVLLALSACGEPIAVVHVTTSGGAFLEDSIPATAFEDGWSVKFSRFLVVLRDTAMTDAMGTVGVQQPGAKAFDLTKKGPVELFAATGPAKALTVRYGVGPDSSAQGTSIEEADLALLKGRTASVIAIGTATKGAVMKSFEWSFTTNTLNDACQPGVTLTQGKEVTVQLTIHGDQLFADQLSGDAKRRFDALASADTNNDGKVTLDELNFVQLTTLPQGQYGVGGATTVKSLKDFVTQRSRAIGGFEGEGTCTPKAR